MSNDKLFRFDKGGELPTGLGYFKNATGRDIPVYAAQPGHVQKTGWNINKGRSCGPFLQTSKRNPIVKVRRNVYTIFGAVIFKEWRYKCRLCPTRGSAIMWRGAIKAADRHARSHRTQQ